MKEISSELIDKRAKRVADKVGYLNPAMLSKRCRIGHKEAKILIQKLQQEKYIGVDYLEDKGFLKI